MSVEDDDRLPVDSVDYALYAGIPSTNKAARELQSDAYVNVQRKVVTREDSARVLLISANVLTMSVMSTQLNMYRWYVGEAQTVAQATSLLQQEVIAATKRGYQASRARPKPAATSRYTDEEGLKDLYAKTQRRLDRKRERAAAAAAARAAGRPVPPELERSSSSSSDDEDDHGHHGGGSSSSSVCSAEGKDRHAHDKPAAPAGTVTRLVIVDYYTHEPFKDIIDHLRYMDNEFGLQLVVMVLLPTGRAAIEAQGAGVVLNPEFHLTLEDAYRYGYDLALPHYFDHIVVDFLTETFVSSAGRWRNDLRSKAAVGNYVSLKNVLQGRIDPDALRQLAWDENVADEDILNAMERQGKRYSAAAQKLNQNAPPQGPDVLTIEEPDDMESSVASTSMIPTTLPRLRSRNRLTRNGVQSADRRESYMPLTGFSTERELLQTVMNPARSVQRTVRRRRKDAASDDETEAAYEDVLVDEQDSNKALLLEAIEHEMARLMAEGDQKQGTIDQLQAQITQLKRSVALLKRSRTSAADAEALDLDSRPDSASFINLSKEQQIYMLKERLEQANEKIFSLMGQRNSSGSNSLTGAQGNRGPKNSKGARRDPTSTERVWRKRHLKYLQAREAEHLSLEDLDANFLTEENRGVVSYAQQAVDSDDPLVYKAQADQPEQVLARRREKEATDRVVASLQQEIAQLQMASSGSRADGDSAHLVLKLKEAMERLTAQQQRVQFLEEMRKMDEVLFARQLQRAVDAVREEEAPVDDGKRKGKKAAGGKRSAAASSSSASTSGGNAKLAAQYKKQLAALEAAQADELDAARRETLDAAAQQHLLLQREQMRELEEHLQRLYLKVRKPYTAAHKQVLEEEYAQAMRHAQGARQRLEYGLRQQQEATRAAREANDVVEDAGGLFSDAASAADRQRLVDLAKEYAGHALQARRAKEGLQVIEDAHSATAGLVQLSHLLKERDQCVATATALEDAPGTALQQYLDAMVDVAAADEDISLWGDVDLSAYLRRAQAEAAPVATEAQLQLSPQELPAGYDLSTVVVRLVDTDGTLQEMADISRVISVSDAEGSTNERGGRKGKGFKKKAGESAGSSTTSVAATKGAAEPKRTGTRAVVVRVPVAPTNAAATMTTEQSAKVLAQHESAVETTGAEGLSLVQQSLYKVYCGAYKKGTIHPERMAAIDAEVGRRAITVVDCSASYAPHHQELLRLVTLLSMHYPALQPLVQAYTAQLERVLAAELEDGGAGTIRLPFLVATDTALLTWAVDFLKEILWTAPEAEAAGGADAPLSEAAQQQRQALEELFERPVAHLAADDDRLQAYETMRRAAVHQYRDTTTTDSQFDAVLQYLRSGGAAANPAEQFAGAEELAALFSRKNNGGDYELTAEELYLNEMAAAGADDPNGEYAHMVDSIRAELAYLNGIKQQRMEELLLRFKLQQRERGRTTARPAGATDKDAAPHNPLYDGEIPDFDVKPGCPSWYGMEAARRVRDILKREKKEDQVTLAGGEVGAELSRRTAFPKPPPTAPVITQSVQDRLRAARALPPLRHSRSRGGQAESDRPRDYVAPRDAASVNAYNTTASASLRERAGWSYGDAPHELEERIEQYRASLSRMGSRSGTAGGVGRLTVDPVFVPVPGSSGGLPAEGAPPGRAALPQVTRWTYGMADEDAAALLQREQEAQGPRDTTVFLPTDPEGGRRSRRAVNFNPQTNFYAGSSAFVNPSAMAAMRLSAMMTASMGDPTVVGSGPAGVGALRGPARRQPPPPPSPQTAAAAAAAAATADDAAPSAQVPPPPPPS